jgi:hypothetical protein
MKKIEVLIIVDASGALASNDLSNNVYLVDTNKYFGSWGEGACELHTACHDQQSICWRVTPISQDNEVSISQFTGQIITSKVCVPVAVGTPSDPYWEGNVETQGATGSYQYSVVLVIDGKSMQFDPFLVVQ